MYALYGQRWPALLGRLLVSRLVEEIKGLDPGRTESVELASYYCFFIYFCGDF
jgi:hypothetical protein